MIVMDLRHLSAGLLLVASLWGQTTPPPPPPAPAKKAPPTEVAGIPVNYDDAKTGNYPSRRC
jgi:hypothetical protein